MKHKNDVVIATTEEIESKIFNIRGVQVMIDRDIAGLYGVETKVLNQAVKRNIERFPASFRFQLFDYELEELVTNCDRMKILKHSSSLPYAFTEQGIAMLASVVRSEIAVSMSIRIMETFVVLKRVLSNGFLYNRLEHLELKQIETSQKINQLFEKMDSCVPQEGVLFEGQVFDARLCVIKIIKRAQREVILIDPYVDITTIEILDARNEFVRATIYTEKITSAIENINSLHTTQYPNKSIEIKKYSNKFHDRFLIIDDDVYHFGASFKDLGKRLFAFDKMGLSKDLIFSAL